MTEFMRTSGNVGIPAWTRSCPPVDQVLPKVTSLRSMNCCWDASTASVGEVWVGESQYECGQIYSRVRRCAGMMT